MYVISVWNGTLLEYDGMCSTICWEKRVGLAGNVITGLVWRRRSVRYQKKPLPRLYAAVRTCTNGDGFMYNNCEQLTKISTQCGKKQTAAANGVNRCRSRRNRGGTPVRNTQLLTTVRIHSRERESSCRTSHHVGELRAPVPVWVLSRVNNAVSQIGSCSCMWLGCRTVEYRVVS